MNSKGIIFFIKFITFVISFFLLAIKSSYLITKSLVLFLVQKITLLISLLEWHLFHLLRNLCRAHDTLEDVAQIYDEIIDKNEDILIDFENAVK